MGIVFESPVKSVFFCIFGHNRTATGCSSLPKWDQPQLDHHQLVVIGHIDSCNQFATGYNRYDREVGICIYNTNFFVSFLTQVTHHAHASHRVQQCKLTINRCTTSPTTEYVTNQYSTTTHIHGDNQTRHVTTKRYAGTHHPCRTRVCERVGMRGREPSKC